MYVSGTPHPSPRIKINTPCPSPCLPAVLPALVTQAGGLVAEALISLALLSCLHLLLISFSGAVVLYVSST